MGERLLSIQFLFFKILRFKVEIEKAASDPVFLGLSHFALAADNLLNLKRDCRSISIIKDQFVMIDNFSPLAACAICC